MKTITILNLWAVLISATFFGANPASAEVQRFLPNIMDRVRQCSVIPVTHSADGRKTHHAMVSHCPEVKVLSPTQVKVKVASHIFYAQITESADSDGGDLFNLVIVDSADQDRLEANNVLAFGDVLLAVLMGNNNGVGETDLDSVLEPTDAN